MSMGSIGGNFNEGNESVQKPLVREFKTQGRLNRGIMPGEGGQTVVNEEPAEQPHRIKNNPALAKNKSPKLTAAAQQNVLMKQKG